ncbi:hypothetical protein U3516DRAFT_746514 [Neocallimastix sp. 'constans']
MNLYDLLLIFMIYPSHSMIICIISLAGILIVCVQPFLHPFLLSGEKYMEKLYE